MTAIMALWTINSCFAAIPAQVELDEAKRWAGAAFSGAPQEEATANLDGGTAPAMGDVPLQTWTRPPYSTAPLFSFNYGEKTSKEFIDSWEVSRKTQPLDASRTQYTINYTDPATKLRVRCVGVAYADFPTVEWTVYLKNEGAANTPIISELRAIDTSLDWNPEIPLVLRHHTGDECTADSYEPHETAIAPGQTFSVANTGGRGTQHQFPYFNLQYGDEGVIFVVSWPGQWKTDMVREGESGVRLKAGQEDTHFTLYPGEEVRTPMIVLQFWKGDPLHAQNVWRQWMIAHNMPRPGGQLPPLPLLEACSSHQFGEMIHANTENQVFFVDAYLKHDMRLDYWWMDAGWYPNKTGWTHTGTWEVDRGRFPKGLREISDHAHALGVQTIVWFEPERVAADTWLTNERPGWVFGGTNGGLLKLNEPEVREWVTNHVDTILKDEAIDLYRQDFNIEPLSFWRANDAEDRKGISENRYVTGYLAYWDELLRRHPDMLIDSCASGGRRNDLETLRRAVPLLRSDYIMEPVGNQCHTWALAQWIPFYGTGTSKTDSYQVRSVLCPSFNACWDMRDESIDFAGLAKLIHEWREFGPYYFGDYYPLTSYSLAHDQWIAWQFHREELHGGMVQVFRREESVYESARFPLKGLDETATYVVTDLDNATESKEYSGAALLKEGLPVVIGQRPGTGFYVYKAKR